MSTSTPATSESSPGTSLPDLLGKFSLPPRADIILRSSDSHDFLVQKLYVVDSSPVLGEKIMAATCHGVGLEASCEVTTANGGNEALLPIVQLAEGRAIISSLLTFVFPVIPVLPPTIEQILELLSVAEKYEMTTALIRIRDTASRRDPPFICQETALQVYSLAWKNGLLRETLEAAEETLKLPMSIQDLEDELDIMPGVVLYDLWEYRQRSTENVYGSLNTDFANSKVCKILLDAHLDCAPPSNWGFPLWLDQYLDTVIDDPACLDLSTFHLALSSHILVSPDDCTCSSISGDFIRDFWTALTAAVRESTRKAESGFSLIEGKLRFQDSTSPTTKVSPLPVGLNMQGADVVLRSSDLVSFHVHKLVLAISSPFFNDMFSLPQPRDDEVIDGLPVVYMSEDAEVMHSLLTVLYPIPSVLPDSYEKTLDLLSASQKYNMATVLSAVRSEIGHQLPTTKAAFRAYAIAHSKQLGPEIETAAGLTLDHPMTFEAIGDALQLFEGSALSDLVHFRKRCCDNLLSFFEGFVDGSDSLSKSWFGCQRHHPRQSHSETAALSAWIRLLILQHIQSLKETYTNPLPKPSSLRGEVAAALQIHISTKNCSPCSLLYAMKGDALHDHLYQGTSKARDEEPFRLDGRASDASEDANA